jgi:hypothetical protein
MPRSIYPIHHLATSRTAAAPVVPGTRYTWPYGSTPVGGAAEPVRRGHNSLR